MKLKIIYLAGCILSMTVAMAQTKEPTTTSKKIALIVSIENYPRGTGWPKLCSSNDIPLIRGALEHKGFNHIKVISDRQADRKGILTAFDSLLNKAQKGDMVVIHFSAHGQQITDDANQDEFDGYDESIVAYGAPMNEESYQNFYKKSNYDGSMHLRDDDIGLAIDKIRLKVGSQGHVLLIMDSCCSGTGARGSASSRGGEPPFDLKGKPPVTHARKEETGFGAFSDIKKDVNRGKFVLISGARANEANKEFYDYDSAKSFGSLSLSISKALLTLPQASSYRSLFTLAQAEMASIASMQNPQIEGDVDSQVFGGDYFVQEKFLNIGSVSLDSLRLKVLNGKLQGITVGTTIVVKGNAATNSNDGKTLARGRVVAAGYMDATIQLDSKLPTINRFEMRAFVENPGIPARTLRVSISDVKNKELHAALQNSLANLKMASIVTEKPDLILNDVNTKRSHYSLNMILASNDTAINEKPLKSSKMDSLVQGVTARVKNYAQGLLFKELDLRDENYSVIITRLIPVKPGLKEGSITRADTVADYRSYLDNGNVPTIPEDTYVYVVLKNVGLKDAYYNVIDLGPDGKIKDLLPKVFNSYNEVFPKNDELFLKSNESRVVDCWIRIRGLYGKEVFKVIAAANPPDLAPTIHQATSMKGRGFGNPFKSLLGDSYAESFSRGPTVGGGMSTSEFVFVIAPKK